MTSLIFIGFSIPIAVCDIRSMKIPDLLIYSGISAMLGYRAAFLREGILLYICAALISAVLFVMVRKISMGGRKICCLVRPLCRAQLCFHRIRAHGIVLRDFFPYPKSSRKIRKRKSGAVHAFHGTWNRVSHADTYC